MTLKLIQTQVARLPDAVLAIAKDPSGARAKAGAARARAAALHRGMVAQFGPTNRPRSGATPELLPEFKR